MGSGRSSYLSHVRSDHQILHVWLASIDPVPALGPVNVLVQNVPEGALVVVGNFRKGR